MSENNLRSTMNGKPVFTVPSKTIINFDSGFKSKLLCDGPTFTAGTSCPYSCSFCYVQAQMNKQKPWLEKHGVTGDHMDIVIRRHNAVEIARKQLLSHSEVERQKRKVIYASPLTDVAANMELVRETVEICKVILELTNWDIRLLSKSNLLPKIAELLESSAWDKTTFPKGRIIYGVSTGTLDDNLAAAFEQGTAKVSKRIESLHWLQDNGFRTFGMICPSLPQPAYYPKHYIEFAQEMAAAIRSEKCEHIWAEVLNSRGESMVRTEAALREAGYDADADRFHAVSTNKEIWENGYARHTFNAHAHVYAGEKVNGQPKLRFLQYVTDQTAAWWHSRREEGAITL